jgi:hypothetical protein
MRQMLALMLIALGIGLSGRAEQNANARDSTAGGATAANGYAEGNLSSRFLKTRFYLPDPEKGYYRGTRFDWSGLVSRVGYGNHTFFCEFKEQHDPLNHDDVCGTAEEFGITSPPSYDRAGPGEPFMKIGIGVLERADSSDYKFWQRYKIQKPGEWRIVREAYKIQFTQNLTGPNGWGYEYTKTIEASQDAPVLKITRRLRNTGTETIDTDHYGHNFLRIDNVPAGTNYTLEFPFEPRFGEDSKTQACVELKNRRLVFTKAVPPGQAIWVRLEGFGRREDNEIKIVNHSTGATMTITTDQPLSRLVLYSSGGVLCPEAFIKLTIPPGQTHEWITTYRFAAGTP